MALVGSWAALGSADVRSHSALRPRVVAEGYLLRNVLQATRAGTAEKQDPRRPSFQL